MTAEDKKQLVAKFNDVANVVQQVSLPVGQGMQLGALVAELGRHIDAIKAAELVPEGVQ
jgi:hypothetical protein